MSKEAQSPKQDELSRGNDEVYHTTIPLAAVEAMVKLFELDYGDFENWLEEETNAYDNNGEPYPDWLQATLNCENDDDRMPFALHTFLMDWRPE